MQTIIPLIIAGLFVYLMFSRKGEWVVVAATLGTIQKDPKISIRGTTPVSPWAL